LERGLEEAEKKKQWREEEFEKRMEKTIKKFLEEKKEMVRQGVG
jgi:hypothetical protein